MKKLSHHTIFLLLAVIHAVIAVVYALDGNSERAFIFIFAACSFYFLAKYYRDHQRAAHESARKEARKNKKRRKK